MLATVAAVSIHGYSERREAARGLLARLAVAEVNLDRGGAAEALACDGLERLPGVSGLEAGAGPALGGPLLASWKSVAGCGAGASVGTGGGVKWIGRNVRGGLFRLECQANYVKMPYGYNFVGTTLVSHDLTTRWNLGVSVPYLYKYMDNPYDVGVDIANKGPGDVNVLLTHRMGALQTWNLTLAVGAPTGTHDVKFRTETLPQDRQLGLGRPTASIVLDHTIDNDWGPVVLGGTAGYRGGTNDLGSYRAPSASLYSYASYLLGPFAPAIGLTATGFYGLDLDLGQEQALPLVSVAASVSLEWSSDWVAVLLGASFPYDYGVHSESIDTYNRFGAWTVALGVAFAMF